MNLTFGGASGVIILLVYAAIMLALGWVAGRRRPRAKESLAGYFLAGRDLGLVALFFTLYATQYSGNSVVGYAPTAYRTGFSWWMSVPFMTAVVVAYLLFAPRLYMVARRHHFVTPIDWIHHRFGSRALAGVVTFLLLWGLGNYLLEQLVAMGQGISGLTGNTVPYQVGVIGFVLVMLTYSWVGGMRAVAMTDVMQGIALLLGVLALLLGGLYLAGGTPGAVTEYLHTQAPDKIATPEWPGLVGWLSMIVMVGLAAAMYPHAIQRVYAARSEQTLRRSLAGMAWMPLVTTAFVFVIGIIGITLYPGLTEGESEQLVGRMANDVAALHPVMYLLMVVFFGGVVAAIVSTADSALLAFGSMISRDVFGQTAIGRRADEATQVKVGKWVSVAAVAVLLMIAWNPPGTLYQIFVLKLELLAQIAPAFMLGLYWKRMSATGALVGAAVGAVLAGGLTFAGYESPWGLPNGIIGLLANVALVVVLSYLRPDPRTPDTAPVRTEQVAA
ncbi:sodium:solute symporter family protein [Ornithinicoccus halotolerans]|uniref:sodium:solute symporter family protein n=1 Tax=Ornithinicoccus halotolerans TaxID=1748220 RepID=UPI001294EC09|nr:sodium:solute symporter family protein [Ornithinicoccus halotolerans]